MEWTDAEVMNLDQIGRPAELKPQPHPEAIPVMKIMGMDGVPDPETAVGVVLVRYGIKCAGAEEFRATIEAFRRRTGHECRLVGTDRFPLVMTPAGPAGGVPIDLVLEELAEAEKKDRGPR